MLNVRKLSWFYTTNVYTAARTLIQHTLRLWCLTFRQILVFHMYLHICIECGKAYTARAAINSDTLNEFYNGVFESVTVGVFWLRCKFITHTELHFQLRNTNLNLNLRYILLTVRHMSRIWIWIENNVKRREIYYLEWNKKKFISFIVQFKNWQLNSYRF